MFDHALSGSALRRSPRGPVRRDLGDLLLEETISMSCGAHLLSFGTSIVKVFSVGCEAFSVSCHVFQRLSAIAPNSVGSANERQTFTLLRGYVCNMSRDSGPDSHSALLVEAGEILQKLSPSRLATLLFVSDDDIETQAKMADILDISPSTVSIYLQSLEDLPLSLTKREHHYKLTSAGDAVIELLDSMFGHLGKDLSTLDWRDEDERDHIGELLTPLHNSRSAVPFFVLYSIGQHSAVEGQLDRFVSPESVQIEDVIADVKKWQEERGKSGTRKQVRSMLKRFKKYDEIEFDDELIILSEKGQEHVRLLERLIDLLEGDEITESSEDTFSFPSSSAQQTSDTQSGITTTSTTDRVGLQLGLQRFIDEQEDAGSSDLPTIVPAYGISSPNGEGEDTRSPSTVLPLTPTISVEDLADQIHRIGREHGNVQLELFWTELPSETSAPDSSDRSQLQR